jgi:hypothetical protein
MKKAFLILTICTLAAAYGCSLIPTAPSKAAPATVVVPNVGTNWMFQNTYIDSTGKVLRMDTSTRTVVAVNQTIQGDSGVVETIETFTTKATTPDTLYLRYLSDGDISRLSWPLIGPHIAPEWLTIGYHTHVANPYLWSGGIGGYKGYTQDTVAFTTTFAEEQNDTVAGTVYSATVMNATVSEHYTGPGKDSVDINTQTNAFIASNGIFGSRGSSLHTINGKQVTREQQVLIAVNIK